ncbi:MAG: Maf-like protein [Pararhizobium sp.]
MPAQIILASSSPYRRMLLANVGVVFDVVRSEIDERAAEAPLLEAGADPEDIAGVLAEAKATDVAERHPDAFTIGADQTLSLGDRVFHKPADMAEAREHLLALSGRTHHLNSAVVLMRGSEVLWQQVFTAAMTMRKLDPGFIGRHLADVGEKALQSVGAYQYEGPGIQLFEKVEGDYFTIVGLPMIPLLDRLRAYGAIDG